MHRPATLATVLVPILGLVLAIVAWQWKMSPAARETVRAPEGIKSAPTPPAGETRDELEEQEEATRRRLEEELKLIRTEWDAGLRARQEASERSQRLHRESRRTDRELDAWLAADRFLEQMRQAIEITPEQVSSIRALLRDSYSGQMEAEADAEDQQPANPELLASRLTAIREQRDRDVRAALSAEQVSALDAWKSRPPTPETTR